MSDIDLDFSKAQKCDICGKVIVTYNQLWAKKQCCEKCNHKARDIRRGAIKGDNKDENL